MTELLRIKVIIYPAEMHAGDNHQRSQDQMQVSTKPYVIHTFNWLTWHRILNYLYESNTSGSGGQGFAELIEKVIDTRFKDHLTAENQSALTFYSL